jgi:hypothetical protein
VNVSLVPKEDYIPCFKAIHDYIEKSAKYTYGRFNAQDIKDLIYHTDKQLWVAYKNVQIYGFVVTEIVTYPQMKTLMMHFTGGVHLNKWKDDMLKTLQSFAKNNECDVIESYGRKGWGKVFEQDGYNPRFIYYELPLE